MAEPSHGVGFGGNSFSIYFGNLITAAGCRGILSAFAGAGPARPELQYVTPTRWYPELATTSAAINAQVPSLHGGRLDVHFALKTPRAQELFSALPARCSS